MEFLSASVNYPSPIHVCVICLLIFHRLAEMDNQSRIMDRLRATFRSGVTVTEQFRRTQLNNLLSLVTENEQLIVDALHNDLNKVRLLILTKKK